MLIQLANKFASKAAACEIRFVDMSALEERAYPVIKLYAEWESFCHQLLYVSAVMRPVSAGGLRLNRVSGLNGNSDFERRLIKALGKNKGKKLSHAWGTPFQFIRAADAVGPDNRRVLNSAVSMNTSPADQLRVTRNFLAHRNHDTASQLQLDRGVDRDVPSVLQWLEQRQVGGQTRFGVWAGDLSDVARAAVF